MATGSAAPRPELIGLIAGLADKSQLLPEPGPGTTRYRLLRTTRHFAAAKLRESGQDRAAAARHARFYAGMAERMAARARIRPGGPASADPAAAFDDIRAALAWCFGPAGDEATGVRLAAAAALLRLDLHVARCRALEQCLAPPTSRVVLCRLGRQDGAGKGVHWGERAPPARIGCEGAACS